MSCTGGRVTNIELLTGGKGYTDAPSVYIVDNRKDTNGQPIGGTGATAVATIFNGEITDINITSFGTGYSDTEPPTMSLLLLLLFQKHLVTLVWRNYRFHNPQCGTKLPTFSICWCKARSFLVSHHMIRRVIKFIVENLVWYSLPHAVGSVIHNLDNLTKNYTEDL